ncbi:MULTISPECIES: serine protein kinase RIO [Acidianus]|uniref:serine protein kinase RIO n=1 Tax=Acidianus TaxID=12914 RepID=UPI0006950C16|nr:MULTISPECIES: serine protein kinase RIO [Acidianus]NON63251.1 serine protein kinase RIO [Acidianus sp. RZ1]
MEKRKEEKRLKDKDLFKVVDSTIDAKTFLILQDLARKYEIEEYWGAVSSGKEARVYPAKTYNGNFYAVKIYYTTTSASKRAIERYAFSDRRFSNLKTSNTRKIISIWAKKEFKNLSIMHDNGIIVPKPIGVRENILIMEFIGDNGIRAPLLKEISKDEVSRELYDNILLQVELMVKKAGLVHGDLSEYNVMIWNNKEYIIDVSQSVTIDHENSQLLLKRDIDNINRFFESCGVEVDDSEEILKRVWIST